jgi:HK97 family phage portal protein
MRNPLRALFPSRKSSALIDVVSSYLRSGGSGGALLTDDASLRVATFYACVRLVSGIASAVPLHVYRRLPNGGKERQYANSLDVLLSLKPNAWQTPMEFREQLNTHLWLRGNGYAWINWVQVVDRTGEPRNRAQELIPLHPDRIEVEQDDWQSVPRYYLRKKSGGRIPMAYDEVLHIRGMSTDGVLGRSIIRDAAETIGVALDTQRFASRLFTNDATPGVVIKHPGEMGEEAAKRLRENWDELYAGGTRRTAILEEGATLERLTLNPDDAQFLETRDMQRSEICGLFPVPPHLVGIVDKSTSWGTGIEQQNLQFRTYCLGILARRWEQALRRCVIEADQSYFVEHQFDALERADIRTRYGAYSVARQWGWMSVNEIRAKENMNPIGAEGDVYLQPMNMTEAGTPPADPLTTGGPA